jgi:hypothetical protein
MQAVHENATLRAFVEARRSTPSSPLGWFGVMRRRVRRRHELLPLPLTDDLAGVLTVIWTIIGILLVLWLAGFVLDVAGGLIHILLVIALVVFIFRMLSGRKAV